MTKLSTKKEISIAQAKEIKSECKFLNDEICYIEDIDVEDLPSEKMEVKCITLILCLEGTLRYDTNGHTVIAEKNSILYFASGQHVDNFRVMSSTFKGKALLIKTSNISQLAENFTNISTLTNKLNSIDKVKIGTDDIYSINCLLTQIKTFMDKKQNRYQMTFELVHVIIELSLSQAIFYDKYDEQTKDLQLFEQFVDSVEKNIFTQRNISEYHKLLNISPGKLEKIVRSTIEQSPREYIQKRLVTYVCLIAEYTNKKQMPIKKIAELVHYKNQCTLSELVKKHIGISLKQYQNLEPEQQHRIIHRTKADQNAVLKVLPKTYIQEDLIPDLF